MTYMHAYVQILFFPFDLKTAVKDARKMKLVESVRDAMDVTLQNDPTASKLLVSTYIQLFRIIFS